MENYINLLFNRDFFLIYRFNFLHELYAISYMWIGAIGFFITVSVCIIVSAMTGGNIDHVDPSLFASFVVPETTDQNTLVTEKLCKDEVIFI